MILIKALMRKTRGLKWRSEYLWHLVLFIGGLAFGFSLLASLLAGDIYDYQDTVIQDDLPEIDAIVCLGGGRGRIGAAGDLWYRYWEAVQRSRLDAQKIPVLYFSGMGAQVSWPLLAKQIRKEISQKVRPEDVVIERESSNTDANARWLARYAQNHQWKKILLLTSSYHMKRAQFIFDHVLKAQENLIEIETVSVYQEPFAAHEWRSDPHGVRVTLMEYLKWIYYRAIWQAL